MEDKEHHSFTTIAGVSYMYSLEENVWKMRLKNGENWFSHKLVVLYDQIITNELDDCRKTYILELNKKFPEYKGNAISYLVSLSV